MKRYVVTLEKEERDELAEITRKGSHQSQKVINALILLNCDEGEFNEHRAHGEAIAEVLRDEVAAWQASRDRIRVKVNWQFTTDDARVKLKRLYPTVDE